MDNINGANHLLFGLNIYKRLSGQTVTEAFPQGFVLNRSLFESSAVQGNIAPMLF